MSDYQHCDTCKFWRKLNDDSGNGQCKINPPVIVPALIFQQSEGDVYYATRFPVTDRADWCGDWGPSLEERK